MLQIVIPARYESVRLPGKPLININGKAMLEHVYNAALEAYKTWDHDDIEIAPPLVSTDSELIHNFCISHNIPVITTGPSKTGTDRVSKSINNPDIKFIVNFQGDEPTLSAEFIKDFCVETVNRATDKKIINAYCDLSENRALDRNNVKAVITYSGSLCFFTREPQPSFSKGGTPGFYKQIGLYGFTINALNEFCSLAPSNLEEMSNVELMRWLDNSRSISGVYSPEPSYSVDVIEDILVVERL